jgi:ribosomal protein L19E
MPEYPEKIRRQQIITPLSSTRRAVDRLAALDYAHQFGSGDAVRRSRTPEDQECIRKGRKLRDELRANRDHPVTVRQSFATSIRKRICLQRS